MDKHYFNVKESFGNEAWRKVESKEFEIWINVNVNLPEYSIVIPEKRRIFNFFTVKALLQQPN